MVQKSQKVSLRTQIKTGDTEGTKGKKGNQR
jgi:hypothetical protein